MNSCGDNSVRAGRAGGQSPPPPSPFLFSSRVSLKIRRYAPSCDTRKSLEICHNLYLHHQSMYSHHLSKKLGAVGPLY